MATPKQEKLIKLILENIGAVESSKTFGQMLKEAGYSKSIQKNPYLILESEAVQQGLEDVAEDFALLRKNALSELKARDISKERYLDVVKATDTFTKNHQLLTGKETERQGVQINVINYGDNDTA